MPRKSAAQIYGCLFGICLLFFCTRVCAEEIKRVSSGMAFPRVAMKPIFALADRSYLGIIENQFFTVDDVRSDLLLIEIMNTNCVSCKKQAPVYNELFFKIAANPELQPRVKIFAIAVGNNDKEIEAFKSRYEIPYPVIGDPQYEVWDATGRSKTPLTIVIKRDSMERPGVIVDVHLGFQPDVKTILDALGTYLKEPLPKSDSPMAGKGEKDVTPSPIFSEQKIMELMVSCLFKSGIISEGVKTIHLEKSGIVYVGTGKNAGKPVQIFAKLVLRTLPCDACHDAQFLYLFDGTGKIFDLVPLQLAKSGNQPFSEKDLETVRSPLIGKFIYEGLHFNPEVDAVARATISSSIIYQAINEGKMVYDELKAKGMVTGD